MDTAIREKISQYLWQFIKVGIFLILFLPLVMNSNFFFPFIVFKNVLFRLAVELIFVAYLVLAYLDPRFRPSLDLKKYNKLILAVGAFFAVSLLAAIFGLGLYSSFWGNYERMSGLFHFLHLVLYFFVLVNVFKQRADWHSFLTFSIFASVLMVFLGFAQYLEVPFLLKSSGDRRLTGTVGNAAFFAAYLLFSLFFLMYFWAKEKRFDLKLFALSFLVFDSYIILSSAISKIFIAGDWGHFEFLRAPILFEAFQYPKFLVPFLLFQLIILVVWFLRSKTHVVRALLSLILLFEFFIFFNTQTRGAIIAFGLSLAFLCFVSLFLKLDKRIKITSLIFLLLAVTLPIALYAARDSEFVRSSGALSRLSTISLDNVTTESRLLTWQASWRGWTDSFKSFLIGYGPEHYYYAFNKYFPSPIYRDHGSQIWFDRAHNIIFDVSVTTGLIGLLAYFGILFSAGWYLFKRYQKTKNISSSWLLISLLFAYFAQNFFVFDTLNTEIPLYLFLGFIVFLTGAKVNSEMPEEEEPEKQGISPGKINYFYFGLLAVILILGLGVNIRTLKSNNYIFKALINSQAGIGENSTFDYFKKSIDQAVSGRFEARQQLAGWANGAIRNTNYSPQEINTIADYATAELKKSVDEEPANVRHYLFLSTFLNSSTAVNRENPGKVINLMAEAILLSPTRPQVYYEIAQAYTFTSSFDKAEEYFAKGLVYAPRVIDDHWNLLAIYIISKQYEKAEEQFQNMQDSIKWTPDLDDYKRLVTLYGRVGNNSKAIELQQKVVELSPTAEEYAQLAAFYAKIGQNQNAIAATNEAIKIDPNFRDDGEKFLKLLETGELLNNEQN